MLSLPSSPAPPMRASPSLPERLALDLGDETVDVELRVTTRGKHIRLQVRRDGDVRIVAPADAELARIEAFIAGRRTWIAGKRARKLELAGGPRRLGLQEAGVVWLNGRSIAIHQNGSAGRSVARLTDGHLNVAGPASQRGEAIERWYRRTAREKLPMLVAHEAARLGLEYSGVAIRAQRTRWGSCASKTRSISLNWRLMLAPPDVQRYVVVHELCHLVEANHSRAFWRTLDAAMPDWRAHSAWLREHGHEMLNYSPSG